MSDESCSLCGEPIDTHDDVFSRWQRARDRLLDELRETWLDEWRTRWESEHTDEEIDAARDGDSSYGGHPYWTEPTEVQLVAYAEAVRRAGWVPREVPA